MTSRRREDNIWKVLSTKSCEKIYVINYRHEGWKFDNGVFRFSIGGTILFKCKDLWVISETFLFEGEAFGKTGRCTITGYKTDFD